MQSSGYRELSSREITISLLQIGDSLNRAIDNATGSDNVIGARSFALATGSGRCVVQRILVLFAPSSVPPDNRVCYSLRIIGKIH